MKRADQVTAVLLLFFAGFVMLQARQYPFWHEFAPGPGFLPFWLGALLAVSSLALLAGTLSQKAANATWMPDRAGFTRLAAVFAMSAGGALLSYLIGMVLAMGVYMAAVLWYLEPGRLRRNLAVALLTPPAIWLVFARWLGVPMPTGPLGF